MQVEQTRDNSQHSSHIGYCIFYSFAAMQTIFQVSIFLHTFSISWIKIWKNNENQLSSFLLPAPMISFLKKFFCLLFLSLFLGVNGACQNLEPNPSFINTITFPLIIADLEHDLQKRNTEE